MDITQQLDAETSAIRDLVARKHLSHDDAESLRAHVAAAKGLKAKARFATSTTTKGDNTMESIGSKFVVAAGDQLKSARGHSFTASAQGLTKALALSNSPEAMPLDPLATTIDTDIVPALRRPTIIDRFGTGTVDGMALTFFREGDYTTSVSSRAIAEGAQKAKMDTTWSQITVPVTKVASYIEVSDEMLADLPFVRSEIDDGLIYDLGVALESQTINGTGVAPEMTGLLAGHIQTLKTASGGKSVETLYSAITAVATATGLAADTIVLNPADFETIRLSKDSNGQYFGGGFFGVSYGGSVAPAQTLWGVPVVTTPALATGTAIVGAFKQGATLYSRGGVDVEATNSHGTNFTSDITTIRAEIRAALAIRQPKAFVAVTLAPAASGK